MIIEEDRNAQGGVTAKGKVGQGDTDTVHVEVPAGTSDLVCETSWKENWGAYPTDDIDMIVTDPSSALFFDGATGDSPERLEVSSPVAGTWRFDIEGFTVHGEHGGPRSKYELRCDADGVRLN